MKILLINDNHTPTGGAEQYFFELKAKLKTLPGLEIDSLGFGPSAEKGDDYRILKGSSSKLSRLLWRCLFHPFMYRKIRQELKKIKPDIVHLHNIKQYPLTLLRALRGYPVVQTVHDYSCICPTGQNIHQDLKPCSTGLRMACFWRHHVKFNHLTYLALAYSFFKIRKELKRRVRQFIAPSPLLAEYLRKNHFGDAVYVPPFISQNQALSAKAPVPGHFLFAGNLGTHKGTALLLDEFALALKSNPDLVLNIAGMGPEEPRMRQKVKERGMARQVHFLGWRPDLRSLYAQHQAVIFPSIGMESFGLVITEAMSHARPVIGVDFGTSAWLIADKQTGLLFDPGKPGDLAGKIVALASDPEFAKQLGNSAREELRLRFDDEKTLEQLLAIYKKTSSRPATGRAG